MGKILLLLVLALAGVVLFKTTRPRARRADGTGGAGEGAGPGADAAARSGPVPSGGAERMVQCARCGTYMPESDSVQNEGGVSCRDPSHCAHRVQQPG